MIKTCKNCGQQFDGRANKEFCSKKCNNEYAYRMTKNGAADISSDDSFDLSYNAPVSTETAAGSAENMHYNRLKSANKSAYKPTYQSFRHNSYPQNTNNADIHKVYQELTDAKVRIKELEREIEDKDEEVENLKGEIAELQNTNGVLQMNRVMYGDAMQYQQELSQKEMKITKLQESNSALSYDLKTAQCEIETVKDNFAKNVANSKRQQGKILAILDARQLTTDFKNKISYLYSGWSNASEDDVMSKFSNFISGIVGKVNDVFNSNY